MSVEDLKKAVLEKAKAEAEVILHRAKEESRKIIEEAETKKKMIIEQKKISIMTEINPDAKIAEARYKARLLIAEAKNSILMEIRKKIITILNSLTSAKRFESLKKLADEAMQELLNSIGRVSSIVIKISHSDSQYADTLKKYIEENYNVKVEDVQKINIVGGIIIECMEGEIVIDNSYDERLNRVLKDVVPKILGYSS